MTTEIIQEFEFRVEDKKGRLIRKVSHVRCTRQMAEVRARILFLAAKIEGQDPGVAFSTLQRVLQ